MGRAPGTSAASNHLARLRAGAGEGSPEMPISPRSSRSDEQAPDPMDRSTWTLISLGGGAMPMVWHQHGDGMPPVRLQSDKVGSSRVPSRSGRAYVCPECDELAVVSLPDA